MEEVSPKVAVELTGNASQDSLNVPLKYFNVSKDKYKKYLLSGSVNASNNQPSSLINELTEMTKSGLNNTERGQLFNKNLTTNNAIIPLIKDKFNKTANIIKQNEKKKQEHQRPYLPSLHNSIVKGTNLPVKNLKTYNELNRSVKKSTTNPAMLNRTLQLHNKSNISNQKSYELHKSFLLSTGKTDSFSHLVSKEKFEYLKLKAKEAINESKIFTINSNSNGAVSVRKALKRRGWIERFNDKTINYQKFKAIADDKNNVYEKFIHAPDVEAIIISNLLKCRPVRFLWTDNSVNWNSIHPSTIVNKFPSTGVALWTKTGLLKCLQTQIWTNEQGKSYVKYPRTFSIYDQEDLNYFSSVYRLTACVNILKKFYYNVLEDLNNTIAVDGMVDIKHIDFAIERVCEYLGSLEHAYIDLWNLSVVSDVDWENFICDYYNFAHNGRKIRNTEKYELDKLITSIKACLDRIKIYWPDVQFEGVENLWLIKPAAQSCGRGIVIMKTLNEIRAHCLKKQPVIVQKYIEKPLLIYNTKFDIRQWFLVTSSYPLRIYMYGKCYLRFCSKEFSLVNLHESVHLSNNSIQWRYEHLKKHNPKLPRQNMWDSDQFQEYLKSKGEGDKWNQVIVPGIRRCIIGAMLACQEGLSDRRNCFNLYGADFLLTEEMTPLLIEINSCPCMRSTTDVTSKLCPMVLDDTVQVATSLRPVKDSGQFQLIYEQYMGPEIPIKLFPEGNKEMAVNGWKAHLHGGPTTLKEKSSDPKLLLNYKRRNHWSTRTLKYENLCWYKTKSPSVTITATIDRSNSYAIPKYPGDCTPQDKISYTSKTVLRPEITVSMENYRDRISQHLN